MKLNCSDPKLRFTADGTNAVEEVIRHFIMEIIWRTSNQASNEGLDTANFEQLEKIIPQLVIHFHTIYFDTFSMN